jgi:hypothetical protein
MEDGGSLLHTWYGIKMQAIFLAGKLEGKRQLVTPNCRREDNINIYVEEIMCEGLVSSIWFRIVSRYRLL